LFPGEGHARNTPSVLTAAPRRAKASSGDGVVVLWVTATTSGTRQTRFCLRFRHGSPHPEQRGFAAARLWP